MTRQQAIERYKHEFCGFVLDAAVAGRSGGELSLWLRGVMMRIDAKIGVMHDEMTAPVPETNGKPAQPPQGAKRT